MYLPFKLKQLSSSLKWKIQRFNKGYADIDLWCFNSWFLELIPKMLLELSDRMWGCPIDMEHDEWKDYLTEMAKHFQEACKIDDCEELEESDYKNHCDYCMEEFRKGIKMFEERFWDLWD